MFRHTAHLYDLIYSAKDYEAEASVLRDIIGARRSTASTVLDVACGTGGHLHHLQHWYHVVGVDLDPRMLEVARKRLPGVDLVEADMRSFRLQDRFDAVLCLFSSIGYLSSTEELNVAVANMAAHLSPGGVLIVDGWVRPEAWKEPGVVLAEAVRRDGIAVTRAGRSWRVGKKSHLELHHVVATMDGVQHLVDQHELTLFEVSEYENAFCGVGLLVERIESPIADRDRYVGLKPAE